MPRIEAQSVHRRLVQYASSQMRRYSTDRRAQAHLSGQYAVVKCGDTAAVLIHGEEASPIGSSHNTTMRSLPTYPFPCYPECPNLGKYPQLVYPVMRVLRITGYTSTKRADTVGQHPNAENRASNVPSLKA